MIAQKVIDANQAEKPRRGFVPASNVGTATLWTLLRDQLMASFLSEVAVEVLASGGV